MGFLFRLGKTNVGWSASFLVVLAPRSPSVRYQSLISDSARWERFELRPTDIVISTPAKCGTTWTQMMCALLIFQTPELELALDTYSPWLDMLTRSDDEVFAQLGAQTHRRFIMTHTPLDGIPIADGVTYLSVGRDPRDVVLSMLNHRSNMDFGSLLDARNKAVGLDDVAELLAAGPPPEPASELDAVWGWVDNPADVTVSGSSLRSLVHHMNTVWPVRDDPNVHLMHYDDLQSDLGGNMRRLATTLEIEVPEVRWPELVEAATFASMKSRSAQLVPDSSHGLWVDTDQFFHQGTSGRWRSVLDADAQQRYADAIGAFAAPELVAWLHHDTTAP